MKFIICLLLCFAFAIPSYAVVLFRYTDKETGEERGICYGHEGNPPVDNPDWETEVIDEKLKKHYMSKHKGQLKAKEKIRKDDRKKAKDKATKKLEDLGLDKDTIEAILN